jgi:glycosyltransferase involved in cell wall biosynthesis
VHDQTAKTLSATGAATPESGRAGSTSEVRVAIVVPAYGQPGLLVEALDTALAQKTNFVYAIIVINDGCGFEETDHVCRDFAAANLGKLYYLRKRNGGLSAARNTGINFALAAFPALESIYFLDADNRIEPGLLQSLCDALRCCGPEIGWAYPDVDKFGFSEFCDTSGSYSPLEHLFRNFCEAGSVVSRRMLDAGARFDENMRHGSEDWEFWLQGLEFGFRGVHVPAAGFRYRRRGESTLIKSERNYQPILEEIRTRHPRLFDIRAMMRLEAAVGRRYALYFPDREIVRCSTDVDDAADEISAEAFVKRLLRSSQRPDYGRCPSCLIVIKAPLFDQLCARRLHKALIWNLERMLLQSTFVSCRVAFEETEGQRGAAWRGEVLAFDMPAAPVAGADVHIAAVHAQTLLSSLKTQAVGCLKFSHEPWKAYHQARLDLRLSVPAVPPPPQPGAIDALDRLCAVAVRTWTREEHSLWSNSQIGRYRCGIASPTDFYSSVHRIPSVLPLVSANPSRQVGLVIDPARAALAWERLEQFATALRRQGWAIHLVGLGTARMVWSEAANALFASIIPLPLSLATSEQTTESTDAYLGTPIPWMSASDRDAASGTLAAFDLVISVENNFAHTLVGQLRDLNIETWALLGVADGRSAEIVNACAAFEHAYQIIIVRDPKTLRLCRALGLPSEKLRRWCEGTVSDDEDWCECSELSLSTGAFAQGE